MAVDLNTFISRFWNSRLPQISGGGGSASGVLTVSTTSAATIADTNETDLWTYSMPASTLSADGRALRITAFGSFAATANTKTFRVYFGGTVVAGIAAASNGSGWSAIVTVIRTGASSEVATALCETVGSSGLDSRFNSLSVDTTAAITIKVTGQNGTAAANDLVFRGAMVELLN